MHIPTPRLSAAVALILFAGAGARAEETSELSLKAFRGGQFEYLRVLQAQRALAEARLEYNRSLGEAWQAAGVISGLLLEEAWPVTPAPAPVAAPPAPAPVPPGK